MNFAVDPRISFAFVIKDICFLVKGRLGVHTGEFTVTSLK